VIEAGRVVEMGTHAELLLMGGTYHRLYAMQFAEDEPTPAAEVMLPAAGV
jgi:hypothetical protein